MDKILDHKSDVTSVMDLIRVFKAKKLYLLITPLLFGMIAALYILIVPPRYELTDDLPVRMPRFILDFQKGEWLIGDAKDLSLKDYWDIINRIVLLKSIKKNYVTASKTEKDLPFKINVVATKANTLAYSIRCRDIKLCNEVSETVNEKIKNVGHKLFMRRAIIIAATHSQNEISKQIVELITKITSDLYTKEESLQEEKKILEDFIRSKKNHLMLYKKQKSTDAPKEEGLLSYYLFREYDTFFDKKVENVIERQRIALQIKAIKENRKKLTRSFFQLQKFIDKIENVNSEEELTEKVREIYDVVLHDLSANLPVMTREQVRRLIEPQFLTVTEGSRRIRTSRLASWAIIVAAMACGLVFSSLVIITFAVVREDRRRRPGEES